MRDVISRRAIGKHDSRRSAGNMASTSNTAENGCVVVAAGGGGGGTAPVPEWNGDPVMLKDFANKRKVPGFARVVKGSYMTLGVGSKFSFQKQHHDIYIHAVKMGVKVLAHCVRRVDMPGPRRGQTFTRLYSTDQRLTVPITYQGWFELLSEDGKSARPIGSVPELAKVFPKRCLVRENLKCYVSSGEGRMTFDKSKIIPAGEQLKLCGELSLPAPSEGVRVKLLRCVDSRGDSVYLSFDQKGLFTPIADENDFTGVFNIRDIIRRFRLPLTVKLAQGVRPRVPDSKFSGIIRLDWVYSEETAFVCPVERNHVRLLPVPCDVTLQLVAASNHEEMCSSDMFKSMQAKCTRMVNNYNNTLHLIVAVPESVMKTQTRQMRTSSNAFSQPPTPASSRQADSKMRRSRSREDILMDEIDDLYGYVRDGGPAPPPKTKFQYDSDEESYWEEPAYEPLDDFRARLKAMESGKAVNFPAFYRPADPAHLKGLVGGTGAPAVAPPVHAGMTPAENEGDGGRVTSETVKGGASNSPRDQPTKFDEEPPPLPPRPADMLTTAASTTTNTVNSTTTPTAEASQNATATNDQTKLMWSRRVSAPMLQPQQVLTSPEPDTNSTEAKAEASVDPTDSTSTPQDGPSKRVSRSDSEPSINFPSALSARPKSAQRQQSQSEACKLDWKERLRKFNAMQDNGKEKEKEGSSSASSNSAKGQRKAAQRLAKDFKDSDISSRTKGSSDSPGARIARKRMQTLYL